MLEVDAYRGGQWRRPPRSAAGSRASRACAAACSHIARRRAASRIRCRWSRAAAGGPRPPVRPPILRRPPRARRRARGRWPAPRRDPARDDPWRPPLCHGPYAAPGAVESAVSANVKRVRAQHGRDQPAWLPSSARCRRANVRATTAVRRCSFCDGAEADCERARSTVWPRRRPMSPVSTNTPLALRLLALQSRRLRPGSSRYTVVRALCLVVSRLSTGLALYFYAQSRPRAIMHGAARVEASRRPSDLFPVAPRAARKWRARRLPARVPKRPTGADCKSAGSCLRRFESYPSTRPVEAGDVGPSVGSAWSKGGCSSMVEPQPSKLMAWVRFPSPAPSPGAGEGRSGIALRTPT